MSSKGRSYLVKIKSQAPQCCVAAHPFQDTCNLCSDASPCVLLPLQQLLHSFIQIHRSWAWLRMSHHPQALGAQLLTDGVYVLLLLLAHTSCPVGPGCLETDL